MLPQITLSDCEKYKDFDEAFKAKKCSGYFINLPDQVRYYVYRLDQKPEAELAYLHDSGKLPNNFVFVPL
jgi:hypothetical protein